MFLDNINNYNNEKLNSFNNLYENISKYTEGIFSTEKDFMYLKKNFWSRIHFSKTKKKYVWLHSNNNIDNVTTNMSWSINYVNHNIDIIIKNFKNKINIFLSSYINNLNIYLKDKENNNNKIEILFSNYRNIYNNLLSFDSNNGLLEKLYNITISSNINYCIDNLDYNLILFINYLNDYYFQSYQFFLENPVEIKYKINNFKNVINETINLIREKVNKLFKNRIEHIINSTNYFISKMIDSHCKYILIHIKKDDATQNYYKSKYKLIINNFGIFSNDFNSIKINKDNNSILYEENYNIPIFNIFQDLDLFIINFNNIIKNNFSDGLRINTSEDFNSNNFEEIQNDTNFTDINNFTSNVSKEEANGSYTYNFNIVKLRSGLYYTKNKL